MGGGVAPTPTSSAPQPTAQTNAQTNTGGTPTPKGKVIVPGLGLALSLELIVKPGITQPSLFPSVNISQEMPNEIKYASGLFDEIYGFGLQDQTGKLTVMIKDSVELEQ
jgi:hypothetical protein